MKSIAKTIGHGLLLAVVFTAGAYIGPHLVGKASAQADLESGSFKILSAEKILLRDPATGKTTIFLSGQSGGMSFQSPEPLNKSSVTIGPTSSGYVIGMGDKLGAHRFSIYSDDQFGGYLQFRDANNKLIYRFDPDTQQIGFVNE